MSAIEERLARGFGGLLPCDYPLLSVVTHSSSISSSPFSSRLLCWYPLATYLGSSSSPSAPPLSLLSACVILRDSGIYILWTRLRAMAHPLSRWNIRFVTSRRATERMCLNTRAGRQEETVWDCFCQRPSNPLDLPPSSLPCCCAALACA